MKKVLIFGTGDIGQLAFQYLTHDSQYTIAAFTANAEYIQGRELLGLPVAAFEEVEVLYPPDEYDMLVALSYRKLNAIRIEKYHQAKQKGYQLISYVCSRSVYWGELDIGDNCFIFENQTIQPFVKIGNNVTMWSGNHVGHHTVIGDNCFISSHVVISGHVNIGANCFLGVNSTIRDGINVAPDCIVGAGATIVKDTIPGGVYIGPAAHLHSNDSSSSRI